MPRTTVPQEDINPRIGPRRWTDFCAPRWGSSPWAFRRLPCSWRTSTGRFILPVSPASGGSLRINWPARSVVFCSLLCRAREGDYSLCIEPLAHDSRFEADEWQQWPFNLIHQSFLLSQQWWHNATTGCARRVAPS